MIKTIGNAALDGKRAIVRVDFNVPLDAAGYVVEEGRIVAALPTIKHLLSKGCSIVIMSHLGRPKGKVNDSMRLDGVARCLSRHLGIDVKKFDNCIGKGIVAAVSVMKPGEVTLLENLRFHPEEESNDSVFAGKLASLADFYVNDAFGASHRAHASVVAITQFLPSYAGLLLEKELTSLGRLLESPERPFVAVLGGAKVSDKVKLIENLLKKVDRLLVGGAMAFTFLKVQGLGVGSSKVENDFVGAASALLESGKIVLPVDIVEADRFEADAVRKVVPVERIEKDFLGLDIGPASVDLFIKELGIAKSIVWNGPMGVFEFDRFSDGTIEVAKAIADSKAMTVIGGGDTLAAAEKAGVAGKFTHTSTGGGAMLEFLEGKKLPAVAALEKAK